MIERAKYSGKERWLSNTLAGSYKLSDGLLMLPTKHRDRRVASCEKPVGKVVKQAADSTSDTVSAISSACTRTVSIPCSRMFYSQLRLLKTMTDR